MAVVEVFSFLTLDLWRALAHFLIGCGGGLLVWVAWQIWKGRR
jgi:hypothetical protein